MPSSELITLMSNFLFHLFTEHKMPESNGVNFTGLLDAMILNNTSVKRLAV